MKVGKRHQSHSIRRLLFHTLCCGVCMWLLILRFFGADNCPGGLFCSEQVLHLWLEVLCSSLQTVEKWFHPWSFLRSPGWVQIKCELRWVWSFLLLPFFELPTPSSGTCLRQKDYQNLRQLQMWRDNVEIFLHSPLHQKRLTKRDMWILDAEAIKLNRKEAIA